MSIYYDKHTMKPSYKLGGRVMVYMPHSKIDKLFLPYHYRIVDVFENNLSVRRVDRPNEKPILVNMDCVTTCPSELPDLSWLGPQS